MENIFILHIAIILCAGLIAGWICKRFNASPLIGYLVVGALIGPGGFDLTGSKVMKKALDDAVEQAAELDPNFIETSDLSLDASPDGKTQTPKNETVALLRKTLSEKELAKERAKREERVAELQEEIRK
ncbi:MAG: hypothetical protein IKY61_08460, partial [Thermoguttaceae bacterium]|nr:hypothetical protein [Thermoguttaceae bacterium]